MQENESNVFNLDRITGSLRKGMFYVLIKIHVLLVIPRISTWQIMFKAETVIYLQTQKHKNDQM